MELELRNTSAGRGWCCSEREAGVLMLFCIWMWHISCCLQRCFSQFCPVIFINPFSAAVITMYYSTSDWDISPFLWRFRCVWCLILCLFHISGVRYPTRSDVLAQKPRRLWCSPVSNGHPDAGRLWRTSLFTRGKTRYSLVSWSRSYTSYCNLVRCLWSAKLSLPANVANNYIYYWYVSFIVKGSRGITTFNALSKKRGVAKLK